MKNSGMESRDEHVAEAKRGNGVNFEDVGELLKLQAGHSRQGQMCQVAARPRRQIVHGGEVGIVELETGEFRQSRDLEE